jgi:hypothetical protein
MNEAQLIKTIKAHIERGDKAKDKADQHSMAAGLHLKELKAAHTGNWAEWEELLKTRIGIGKSRASELMQIADGRKTVDSNRAETAKRVAHHRETSPLRNGGEQRKQAEAWKALVAAQKPAIDALAARLVSVDAALARDVLYALTLRGPCGMVEMILYEGAEALAFAIEDALAVREQPTDDGLGIPALSEADGIA